MVWPRLPSLSLGRNGANYPGNDQDGRYAPSWLVLLVVPLVGEDGEAPLVCVVRVPLKKMEGSVVIVDPFIVDWPTTYRL